MKNDWLHAMVCLALSVVLYGCGGDNRSVRMETLMSEINALAADEEQSVQQLPDELKSQLNSSAIANFPRSRASLEAAARKALPYYDHDISRFRLIAEKYAEMEALPITESARASVRLQEELFNKYAEAVHLQRERVELLLDSSILSHEDLMDRSHKIEARIEQLSDEIARLEKATRNNTNARSRP